MNRLIMLGFSVAVSLVSIQAFAAHITFYEGEDFRGRVFSTDRAVANFKRYGFNDRAASVVVDSGRWEVCEDVRFEGVCVVLRRGSYDSLQDLGIEHRISSVRPANERSSRRFAPEPLPAPTYEYRRRPNEHLHEATITSVHAIVGPPEHHCWIERERVPESRRGGSNVGGAIAGAIIGGIIGHQIGGGRGNDIATAGGAVAGGAIGSHIGEGSTTTHDRDMRHCEDVASTVPDYWDVTYEFRGVEHHVQMTSPPGRTILVNRHGEPRT